MSLLSAGNMAAKKLLVLTVTFLFILVPCFTQDFLTKSKKELLKLRIQLQGEKPDIFFLLDTSGSLTNANFEEEKRFVKNFLNTFSIGFDATRVQVILFGTRASSDIDFVSKPHKSKNKCELNTKLSGLRHRYGLTNTKGAFQIVYDVCFGIYSGEKRRTKTVVILLTDGYWNWPFGDSDPTPIAKNLVNGGVEVIAIGVGFGAPPQNLLNNLVADPARQAFTLQSFNQLAELSRYIRGGMI